PISIFPNPTNGIVNVSSKNEIEEIELYDMAGKRLNKVQKVNSIDISAFENGVYVLKVKQNGSVTTKKIVKN
ncbi:MAG: T9SS type A sorting domain-containing protein, partial [Flavobacteriales bacterium]